MGTYGCFFSDEIPSDLSGRLYHLEVMLKQLNNDLEKVSAVLSGSGAAEKSLVSLRIIFNAPSLPRPPGEAGQGGPAGRDGQPAGEQPAASGGVAVGQRATAQVQPDAHCHPGRQEVTSALRRANVHRPFVWH